MKEFVLKQAFDPAKCTIEYAKELNPEQLEVVLNGDGPCLVLAGAGSGKTRTITYRVAYLIENGVAADNILLVTFTNKAAREMMNRVESLLGPRTSWLWGGTFHSIANRVLRQYAPAVGYTSSFTILDEEDAKDLIKMCVKECGVDTKERRFPSPANLKSIVSYARNASRPIEDVVERKHPNFIELIPSIQRIADMYASRKRAADAMDFDDLLLLLRDLVATRPDVRDRLAAQFRYILVDEYQDTNVIQAEIVHALASVHNNLLVVGDDAQSIYSFRAAEIKNILRFPDAHRQAKVFRLTTNYRSSPEILEFANAVIRQNKSQFQKELRAVRDAVEKPNLVPAANAQQEAQYIAEQMLALRDDGVPLPEMAVLFRAAFLSQALEFELMRRDIPYEYRGGMKFFERAHIKDVVAHLRLVANPKDEMAWIRVLSLQPGIGLTTASKVVEQVRTFETLDALFDGELSLTGRANEGWKTCAKTLVRIQESRTEPSEMIRAVVATGYHDYLEAEYPDFMDRLEDLEQFALFAESAKDLKSFLDEISLTENYGAVRKTASTEEERAILSTIHQAKGLEWDAVFVMGLTDQSFPNPRAREEEGGIEEERRLFYVAATRARKHLFLTYPITSGFDTLMIGQPSLFLQELPKNICEEVKLRSAPSVRFQPQSFDDEPTIVLDDMGETVDMPKRAGGFLRNIDDL